MGISRSGRATLSSNSREIGCKLRITIILHLEKNTSMVSVVIENKTKMLVGVHNTVIARAYCNTVYP